MVKGICSCIYGRSPGFPTAAGIKDARSKITPNAALSNVRFSVVDAPPRITKVPALAPVPRRFLLPAKGIIIQSDSMCAHVVALGVRCCGRPCLRNTLRVDTDGVEYAEEVK